MQKVECKSLSAAALVALCLWQYASDLDELKKNGTIQSISRHKKINFLLLSGKRQQTKEKRHTLSMHWIDVPNAKIEYHRPERVNEFIHAFPHYPTFTAYLQRCIHRYPKQRKRSYKTNAATRLKKTWQYNGLVNFLCFITTKKKREANTKK